MRKSYILNGSTPSTATKKQAGYRPACVSSSAGNLFQLRSGRSVRGRRSCRGNRLFLFAPDQCHNRREAQHE